MADPETALTAAGGMPLTVFETDEKRVLTLEQRAKLLGFLRLGRKANAAAAVAAVSRDMTLQAVSVFLSRWAWDLAGALSGVPPRYFPGERAVFETLAAEGLNPAAVFMWVNSVRDVCRVSDHPLTARVVIEQLLLAYLRALRSTTPA